MADDYPDDPTPPPSGGWVDGPNWSDLSPVYRPEEPEDRPEPAPGDRHEVR